MDNVSVSAHFDGERIVLDEPFELEPNTSLIVSGRQEITSHF
jgi:hypothetical protein